MKIAIIIGTKAELIKCVPLMLALKNNNLDYSFIHTGQHPLGKASEEFGVKKPDYILSKEPEKTTKFWSKVNKKSILWSLGMISKIKNIIRELNPDYVFYHGDTMSSAISAFATSKILNPKKKWKNIHLEAGLRSGSLFEPFPEEISRRICDRFSDVLLAVSDLSEENLKKAKMRGKIINIGNTIVDGARDIFEQYQGKIEIPQQEYVLINLHRHENLRSKKRMIKIANILSNVNIKGIWPLHDNTEFFLNKYNLMDKIKENKNIEIVPLSNYPKFISLLANSKYLITDGGSIQEESLIFKKPCILLRKKTERQEGLKSGINFLTNLNLEKTKEIMKNIEENKIDIKDFKNPFGEYGVSEKIVEFLKNEYKQ